MVLADDSVAGRARLALGELTLHVDPASAEAARLLVE
jgi:hypothetical protein